MGVGGYGWKPFENRVGREEFGRNLGRRRTLKPGDKNTIAGEKAKPKAKGRVKNIKPEERLESGGEIILDNAFGKQGAGAKTAE